MNKILVQRLVLVTIIFINLILCAQLSAQERFYEFVPGTINPFITETEQGYLTIGIKPNNEALNNTFITSHINFDGSVDNSYENEFDSTQVASMFVKQQIAIRVEDRYIVLGHVNTEPNIYNDGLITTYNEDMSEVVSSQIIQLGFDTYLKSILNPNDSTLIIGVSYKQSSASQNRAALLNLDLEGNIRWQQDYPCEEGCRWYIQQITPTSDDGFVVTIIETVNVSPAESISHCVYLKVDSEGNEQWSIKPGDYENYFLYPGRAVESEDNNILISYSNHEWYDNIDNNSAIGTSNDSATVFLEKYEMETGELMYHTSFIDDIPLNIWDDNRGYPYQVADMIPTFDGNVLITGTTKNGGFLLKASEEGEYIWFREHIRYPLWEGNGSQFTWLLGASPTTDGGYICSGHFMNGPGDQHPNWFLSAFALKVDEYGCLEPGCHLTDWVEELKQNVTTLDIFPNPNQGVVSVGFPNTTSGLLTITDMLGNLTNQLRVNNKQQLTIDFSDNKNGLYLLHFVSESGEVMTGKVIRE